MSKRITKIYDKMGATLFTQLLWQYWLINNRGKCTIGYIKLQN